MATAGASMLSTIVEIGPSDEGYNLWRGMWRSLVARGVWDAEVAGSNPAIPTY
jgi:hypothetical protein